MHLKSLKRLLAPVLCILLVFGSVFGLTSCESVTTTVDTSTRNNSAFGEFPTIAASPADWDSPIVFTYEQSDENQIAQEKTQSGKWYESRKNIGSCEELNGRVLLYFIFVDEPGLSWNASDKAQLHAQATDTIRLLESEAAAEGVSLTVSSSETDIVWTKTIGWNKDGTANTCDSVMNLLLSNSGSRTFSEMYQSMLSAYNVDSIAYILLSLSTGRGYAHSDTTGSFSHCEHAVLFEKKAPTFCTSCCISLVRLISIIPKKSGRKQSRSLAITSC